MTTINIAQCQLRLARPAKTHEAPALGAVFGRKFEEEVFKHNHGPDGEPIYQYPRVQFKILDSGAVLLGINEGSDLLQRLWPAIAESQLGDEQLQVVDVDFETRAQPLEAAAQPIEYRFKTPWLALNQKNFSSYVGSRNQKFRKDELSRILVGNCLGLAKSLGIRFDDYISADCRGLTSIKTTLNGKGTIGFVGKFSVNLTIPDLLGLGRSAARGFGTVTGTEK